MKKKYLLIIIGTVSLLFLLLISMRIIGRRPGWEQRFPRWRQWLEERRKPTPIPEEPLPILDTPGKKAKRIKTLTNDGGRVDWSHSGNDLIAFDRLGEDGYYDVWTMKPDGSDQRCLTCGKPQLPQKHNGQPAWHPSGKYIIFQSQDPELKGLPRLFERAERALTSPGAGVNNNLWLMTSDGSQFWQLTQIKERLGVLHPHFSHDGIKLLWSELVNKEPKPAGQWAIKIADFEIKNGQPQLRNIKLLQPDQMRFYETHGFSPNDLEIIFSATKSGNYQELDIYVYNLETKELKRLTDSLLNQWDEHAQLSPNGEKIVWMSSQDIEQEIEQYNVITDYWIMDKDGSNKQRLTFFNDPSTPEYLRGGIVAADCSWSPDGKKIAAYIFTNPDSKDIRDQRSSIIVIDLE